MRKNKFSKRFTNKKWVFRAFNEGYGIDYVYYKYKMPVERIHKMYMEWDRKNPNREKYESWALILGHKNESYWKYEMEYASDFNPFSELNYKHVSSELPKDREKRTVSLEFYLE